MNWNRMTLNGFHCTWISDKVGCYKPCVAPRWTDKIIVESRGVHVPQCPIADDANESPTGTITEAVFSGLEKNFAVLATYDYTSTSMLVRVWCKLPGIPLMDRLWRLAPDRFSSAFICRWSLLAINDDDVDWSTTSRIIITTVASVGDIVTHELVSRIQLQAQIINSVTCFRKSNEL